MRVDNLRESLQISDLGTFLAKVQTLLSSDFRSQPPNIRTHLLTKSAFSQIRIYFGTQQSAFEKNLDF